jgi:hypothetical protein
MVVGFMGLVLVGLLVLVVLVRVWGKPDPEVDLRNDQVDEHAQDHMDARGEAVRYTHEEGAGDLPLATGEEGDGAMIRQIDRLTCCPGCGGGDGTTEHTEHTEEDKPGGATGEEGGAGR